MQQGGQTYTVVEYPTCYVVVDQVTREEIVVSKPASQNLGPSRLVEGRVPLRA